MDFIFVILLIFIFISGIILFYGFIFSFFKIENFDDIIYKICEKVL